MPEYIISPRAYCKMIFHAAKYPHLAVNGIILANKSSATQVEIVDIIPLFHQCLYVTPMSEIALMQIDAYAERENLQIAGYYAVSDNFYENSLDRMPAIKIAEKIQENFKNACFCVLDNEGITLAQDEVPLKMYAIQGDSNWSKANFKLESFKETLSAVSALLKRGAHKDVVDFDNHLDNPINDWTNTFLNKDLQQLMAMY